MTVADILAHAQEHLEIAQDEHRAASEAANLCFSNWCEAADRAPDDADLPALYQEAFRVAAQLRDDRCVSLHAAAHRVAALQVRAAA